MLKKLADTKSPNGVLGRLRPDGWEQGDLWQQGEFHHDVAVRSKQRAPELQGDVFVVHECSVGKQTTASNRSGSLCESLPLGSAT